MITYAYSFMQDGIKHGANLLHAVEVLVSGVGAFPQKITLSWNLALYTYMILHFEKFPQGIFQLYSVSLLNSKTSILDI